MISKLKIVVEKHPEGYVAYPLGFKGMALGEGNTVDEALSDVESAIMFHIETFGREVLESQATILEAFIEEREVILR
jgi:predicted RNase H-like HicB family nuclease